MATDPGVVRNQVPLLLDRSQATPETSLPFCSLVIMEILWPVVPVIEAQPDKVIVRANADSKIFFIMSPYLIKKPTNVGLVFWIG
jgi:hypothetical protein